MEVTRSSYCQLCGKVAQSANNRPKSLHKTKRLMKPNLQKWNGLVICSRCRRTLKAITAKLPAESSKPVAKVA